MASEEQELMDQAVLGIEAEQFLASSVGRKMVAKANAIAEEAIEALKVAPPRDHEKIESLQNIIWKAESFKDWLADIIAEGMNAEEQLKPQEGQID